MENNEQGIDLTAENDLASRFAELYIQVKDYESKLAKLVQIKEQISNDRFNELNKEYLDFINQSKPVLNDLEDLLSKKIKELSDKESVLDNEINLLDSQIDQEKKMLGAGAISKAEYENKLKPLDSSRKSLSSKKVSTSRRISTLRNAKEGTFKPGKGPILDWWPPWKTPEGPDGIPKFYKNPSIAVVLSFFWAGLGQIYNGQIGKGVIFIIAYVASALSMLMVIGFVTTPILWVWGMYDAYTSAGKVNAKIMART